MKNVTKLTSVNVIEDVYNKFKVKAVNSEINLQKLVNRSLDLYNNDETFRNKINNHDNLTTTGTKF
jgi:hypothetical protein